MKRFKYDVRKLTEAVRGHPCLWKKTCEAYKDRYERKAAWDEIFHLLDDGYDAMSSEAKRIMREVVLNKWTNIRDTFIKTVRLKATGKCRRQYILYNHLKFLLERGDETKPAEDDDSEYSNQAESPSPYNEEQHEFIDNSYLESESVTEIEPVRKRPKVERNEESIDFVSVEPVSVNDPRIMNEDEAFFASLLPTVVKYDEDERLEFRIEVLSLMRKIKNKRTWMND